MAKPCFGNLGFQLSDRGLECEGCPDRPKCHEETLRLNAPNLDEDEQEDAERRAEEETMYRRGKGRL
jgi:hypothetical protein